MAGVLEPLYAVIHFEPARTRVVRRVVMPFPDARSADLFAVENGYGDYSVAPTSTITPAWRDAPARPGRHSS